MKVRINRMIPVDAKHSEKLAVGTEHETIPTPKGEDNSVRGVWVQGNGEPVKLLSIEYDIVK